MEELNPWDEGYQPPQVTTPAPTQELNPWDDAYQPADTSGPITGMTEPKPGYFEPSYGDVPPAVENQVDSRGVPGGPDYVPKKPSEDLSMGMYDELTPQQSTSRYEELQSRGQQPIPELDENIPFEDAGRKIAQAQISNQRDTNENTSILGEPIVNGQVVNRPEFDVDGNKLVGSVGPMQMTTNAARAAVKNTLLTAASVIDQIGADEGETWGLTEKVDKAIANRPKGGKNHPLQEVTMQLSEYAAGAIAGYKIGNKSGSIMTGGNYSPRHAANFIAKTLAAVGSTIGAVISQDASTETMVTGPEATMGTIFEGVPINPDGSMSEQIIAKKTNLLLDEMTAALGAAKVGQAFEIAGRALKHITVDQIKPLFPTKGGQAAIENEQMDKIIAALNIATGSSDGNVDVLRNAINENMDVVLKLGGADAMPLNRTTFSALEEGLKETNPIAARRAMEIEAALPAGVAPNLASRQQLPMSEFRKFQDGMTESRGGLSTMENTRQVVADEGINRITNARNSVTAQEGNVEGARQLMREDIRNNPFFGEDVRLNEAGPQMDVNQTKSVAEDRVMKDLNDAADNINKTTSENYNKIPAGTKIDEKSFRAAMKEADTYLPTSVRDLVSDEGTILDYKTLKANVLPEVREALRTMKSADTKYRNDVGIRALELLEDNIARKQLATQPRDVQKISNEADAYFRDVKVPFRDSNAVGPLFDKNANQHNLATKTQQAVNAVKDSDKGASSAVLDLMDRPEYKGDKKDLMKVYVGETAAKWGRQLHAEGGIDNINPEDVLSGLGERGVVLKQRYPDEVKQLEDFASRLRDAKGNINQQKEILKQAQEVSKDIEDKAFHGAIGDFIEKHGSDLRAKQDGYQTFKSLLNSQRSSNKVDDLVEIVRNSGDPLAQKGMETAYLTYLKDRVQENALKFSEKQAGRVANEPDLDNLKKYGLKIFQNPDEVEDYAKIVGKVMNETDKRVPDGLVLNAKGGMLKERAANSTRTMITMALGVLNPTASKVRTVANVLIGGSHADEKAAKILDLFASDKEYANKLINQYANYKNNEFSDEARSVLWKLAVASGAYTDADRKSFNEQFKEESKKPVDKETDEVLKKGSMAGQLRDTVKENNPFKLAK